MKLVTNTEDIEHNVLNIGTQLAHKSIHDWGYADSYAALVKRKAIIIFFIFNFNPCVIITLLACQFPIQYIGFNVRYIRTRIQSTATKFVLNIYRESCIESNFKARLWTNDFAGEDGEKTKWEYWRSYYDAFAYSILPFYRCGNIEKSQDQSKFVRKKADIILNNREVEFFLQMSPID